MTLIDSLLLDCEILDEWFEGEVKYRSFIVPKLFFNIEKKYDALLIVGNTPDNRRVYGEIFDPESYKMVGYDVLILKKFLNNAPENTKSIIQNIIEYIKNNR